MKHFGKLVHMEVHRFRFVLLALMAVVFIIQIGSLIFKIQSRLAAYRAVGGSWADVKLGEDLSFVWAIRTTQEWFMLSIFICAAVLGLYVFLIWYRDWFGSQTFAYRLLMLPTKRRTIYAAKLSAFLIFVFVMMAYQLLLLVLWQAMFPLLVPEELYTPSAFTDAVMTNQAIAMLLPLRFDDFLLRYLLGIAAVVVAFTSIMLERSYRGIGIVYGILYAAACTFSALLLPILFGIYDAGAWLYPIEVFAIWAAFCLCITVLSVWLSVQLIERKISV